MFIPNSQEITKETNSKFSVLVYGEPMVGKTYFADTFPTSLFLNTDGNTTDVKRDVVDLRKEQEISYMVNGETKKIAANKWILFKHYANKLGEQEFVNQIKEAGFETIVVDTMDHLYDWCREAVLSARGIEDESQDSRAYAPIYTEIKKEFKTWAVKLIENVKSNFNLIMTSFEDHEEYQDGIDKKTKKVPSLKIKMTNSQGVDKAKVYEAITSRINVTTGIFIANKKTEDGGTEEIRIMAPYNSKDFAGGNRLGIEKPIIPHYEALLKNANNAKGNN